MITIKVQTREEHTLNNKVFEDKGTISTLIIFKPRTKVIDMTERYKAFIEKEETSGSINPTGLQELKVPTTTSRNADKWRRGLSKWIMVSGTEQVFPRGIKFFATVKGYHEVSNMKFRLYTDKIYSKYIYHRNLYSGSSYTNRYLFIKCKNMETYEVLEKLSKNQKLIPCCDTYHLMYLIEKILIKTNTPTSDVN